MARSVDMEALKILNEYPLMVPYTNFKKWEGFVQCKDKDVHLEFDIPNYPSLKGIEIKCPPEVCPLLIPLRDQAEDSSLLNLLRSLSYALKSKSLFASETLVVDKQKLETVISVLKDFDSAESSSIVDLNYNDQTVTLEYVDSCGSAHKITTQYSNDYPKSVLRIVKVDLPLETVAELEGSTSYRNLYSSFKDSVEGLIPFWDLAKDLENECWVIDPEVPTLKDTYRRIFLTTDLSISITFNILHLGEMPEIKFFGCVSSVKQKRAEFMARLEAQGWNTDDDVVSNLKRLLEVEQFPKKPSPSASQDNLDCIICVGGLEQGGPVQKWCNNKKCSSLYHRACLYRWFDELQSAKRYWDYISGPCPLCKAKILCPINEDAKK